LSERTAPAWGPAPLLGRQQTERGARFKTRGACRPPPCLAQGSRQATRPLRWPDRRRRALAERRARDYALYAQNAPYGRFAQHALADRTGRAGGNCRINGLSGAAANLPAAGGAAPPMDARRTV